MVLRCDILHSASTLSSKYCNALQRSPRACSAELGEKWVQFYKDHPKGKRLDLSHDNDPDEFVKKYEQQKKEKKAQQAQ